MWTCSECRKQQQKPETRLPMSWKRRAEDDAIFCGGCWRKNYVIRAVAMPVVSPVDCTWRDLDAALKQMWRLTTQASNWMMTELYARDVRRGDEQKMPAMSRVYLYPESRLRFSDLPPTSIAALENTTQKKYRSMRYDIIWTASASLPTFRYPTPFPVPNQSWSLRMESDVPVVSAIIGESRLSMRLKTGPRFHRQLRAARELAAGQAIKGELALYRRKLDEQTVTMVKMVGWFQRPAKREMTGTLYVRTAAESLIVALNEKDEKLWNWHGDQIPRWQVEHAEQLKRWADDTKMEHRPVPAFAARRTVAVRKQRNRLDDVCHQVSMMIAGYAQRRKFAKVQYDDTERSFVAKFPYFKLKQLIEQKADQVGVEFVYVGKPVTDPE